MDRNDRSPLISVIIPTYNAENYIVQAVDSVVRQTIEDSLEILVIDDCSTDNTESRVGQLIESCRQRTDRVIRYMANEKNLGVAESRNRGIRAAEGKYIAFLDADDWWDADKLRRQVLLKESEGVVLCATARELMRPDGESAGRVIPVPHTITYEGLLRTNSIPCSSVLMDTEVAREFYMCHDELHEDYILWLRVLKKYGSAVGLNEPLLKSRLSPAGKSRNKLKSAGMQFGVYRYMRIGFFRSVGLFLCYAWHGVRKYTA